VVHIVKYSPVCKELACVTNSFVIISLFLLNTQHVRLLIPLIFHSDPNFFNVELSQNTGLVSKCHSRASPETAPNLGLFHLDSAYIFPGSCGSASNQN